VSNKIKLLLGGIIMEVICANTGVPVGSETCKLCVSHGCEGYKQVKKKNKDKNTLEKFLEKLQNILISSSKNKDNK
jgi:hypothetical protein